MNKKLLLTIVLIVLVFVTILYIYTYQLAYLTTDKIERTRIENSLKSSPKLPDRFYEIYNVIYTNSLEQGQLSFFIDRNIKNNYRSECPCRLVSDKNDWISSYQLNLVHRTFFLESFASQKECLNYYASKFIFKNNIGLNNVSIAIFGKKIDNLDDKEYIELVLIMENPSFYNRGRDSEFMDKTINKYFDKINFPKTNL